MSRKKQDQQDDRDWDDLAGRIDVEIAWFYEHCPDPDKWLAGHGNSMNAVFEYIGQFGPRAWRETSTA